MSTQPLRIALYTPQALSLPSQRIRIVEPLAFLDFPSKLILCAGFTKAGQFMIDSEAWKSTDVVIIQRNFPGPGTIDLIRRIAAAGKKIVYETDDAFQLLPDDHPKAFHKANAAFIDETARLAATVVVSTNALKDACYADHPHVVVAENMLSPRIWNASVAQPLRPPEDRMVNIALVGGGHHRHDFFMLKPALEALTAAHPEIRWVAYGDATGELVQQLGTDNIRIIPKNYDYATHPARLASMQADLAICPLLDTPFNRCISDIKFIEFGWLKVPLVASRVGGYREHIQHGVDGMLFDDMTDLKAQVERLCADPLYRAALGMAAHDYTVRERIVSSENNPWNAVLGD